MLLTEAGTTSVMTLETYLTTLGSIITALFEWVVDVLGIITSNPILLVPFGVISAMTTIKILKKIF